MTQKKQQRPPTITVTQTKKGYSFRVKGARFSGSGVAPSEGEAWATATEFLKRCERSGLLE